jgi:hypothetical protein
MPHRSSVSWRAWASPSLAWALRSEAMPATKDRRRDCPGARDRPADRTTRQTQSDRRRHGRVAGRPTWVHRPEVSAAPRQPRKTRHRRALTVALLSSTGVALVCVDCGDSWLAPRWVVAQPQCAACSRCSLRHRRRCHRIASGPADRKVMAKPVRVGPARRLARVRIRQHWRSQYKLGTQPNSAVGCERICERNTAQGPRSHGTRRDGLDGRLIVTCTFETRRAR